VKYCRYQPGSAPLDKDLAVAQAWGQANWADYTASVERSSS